MQETQCLICNSKATLKHDKFQGYQEGTFFKIYFCDTCYTSFSIPKMNANAIYESIYKNGEKVPGYSRYWNYYKNIKAQNEPLDYLADSEEAYWAIKNTVKNLVNNKKDTKILELGSGLGYLTYALRQNGYIANGLDISQEAVDKANAYFGDYYISADLFDYAKSHAETYDIVILTEVIEHIETPIDFIEAIKKVLKPNGKIILTTPNRTIMSPEIIWDSDLPPVHHWWFSETSISHMAKHLDLDINFVDFTKYYKKHHTIYNSKKKKQNKLPEAILDKNLQLAREAGPIKIKKEKLVYKIPMIKNIYLKLKTMDSDKILCSERGICLCAILTKK
jgi:2-polyprenyl-3-methyl-5-hydroxy-6-metoxy-1,4-benzoquinol methylase